MDTQLKFLFCLVLFGGIGFTVYMLFDSLGGDPVVIEDPIAVINPEKSKDPKELRVRNTSSNKTGQDQTGTNRTRIDGPNLTGVDCEQGVIGRLINPRGGPVADAVIYMMPGLTDKDTMRMLRQHQEGVIFPPVAKSTSAPDGTFTLGLQHWKEDDKYEVRIIHPDFCDHRLPNISPQPNDWWDCGNITLKTGVTVFGRVTTGTGLPIAGATVSAVGGSGILDFAPTPGREKGLSTAADNSGNYEIRNIDPISAVSVSAIAENFAKSETNDFQLAGSSRHQIDFELVPGLNIAGTVVDSKGSPVQGAAVTVSALSQKSHVMDKRFTDKDGDFIVAGLRGGPHSIMIEAEGYLKIEESPFQAGDKDLKFTLESQGRVYLTVIDKNNRPLPNYHVNLKVAFEGQEVFGKTAVNKSVRGARDGSVLIEGINPMTYVAEVSAAGHAKNFSKRFTITEGQAEPPRIAVNLNAGGSITGTVSDLKGKPIAGVTVITRPSGMIDNPLLQIFQVPYTVTKRGGKTDQNGRFKFDLMNPGKYQLKLTSEEHCAVYVQGIDVVLGEVSEHHGIKMTRGCSVSGLAKVNGKPTAQVKVSINSVADKDNPAPFSAEAVSDNEGRFLLTKRLRPGKYEVMAAEQVQTNPLLMMLQFSKSKQEIVIPAGAEHQVIAVNITKDN